MIKPQELDALSMGRLVRWAAPGDVDQQEVTFMFLVGRIRSWSREGISAVFEGGAEILVPYAELEFVYQDGKKIS